MKRFFSPHSLFARTGLTVALALLLFMLLSIGIIINYLFVPMARGAAEDLSGLMVLSAQTWVELPPDTRKDFEEELLYNHDLKIKSEGLDKQLEKYKHKGLYLRYLRESLSWWITQEAVILTSEESDKKWVWVDIPLESRTLRVGFPADHLDTRLPFATLLLIALAIVVTLLTSLFLVMRLIRPIRRLSWAVEEFGHGEMTQPIPETGPQELASLAQRFNRMMEQIKTLLKNRTILLAGISHDLRTPIARIRLAIEMLDDSQDKDMIKRITNDLEEMDHLIGRTLGFSRALDNCDVEKNTKLIELNEFISQLVNEIPQSASSVEFISDKQSCETRVNVLALNRVLSNLLENAQRYGLGKPIKVELKCQVSQITIVVADHGSGIPEDELESVFQPFYRLEGSRNVATGGSGLGLAIVQQLCESHGWKVELKTREGGGTEAWLTVTRK